MKKQYKHIFFDLDNTLWDFKKNSYHAMHEAFKRHINNGHIDYKKFFEVYSLHNRVLWKEYRNQVVPKSELVWLRFQKTFDELEVRNVSAAEMNVTYLEKMPEQTALLPDAEKVLHYLKAKGYNLSIISNGFREVQFKKLENTGLLYYFTKVFLSEDVKVPKPGAAIFKYAVKSVNAKKAESIMIGDDWETDVQGALKFGIDAVYLNRNDGADAVPEITRASGDRLKIVSCLTELKYWL